jgi:cathepsin H
MQKLLLLLILTYLCTARVIKEKEYAQAFSQYIHSFEKTYSTSEVGQRYQNFKQNYEIIQNFNPSEHTYTIGLTSFSDMSWDEFKSTTLMAPQHCSATHGNYRRTNIAPPESIDWRTKGVVTPVKNQGQCGSCWSFSTTGCLEAHNAIVTGNLVSLSEQNLVDCAHKYKNNGCQGGLPSQAFEYILYNKGINTEAAYPYRGVDGQCKYNASNIGAIVNNVFNITALAENDILEAVGNVGPVSVCFDVVNDFMNYHSGVYTSTRCRKGDQDVNHAVLVVGYGTTEQKKNYWIVKNSWGSRWGLQGYFWIARGNNECGLAQCASYPGVPKN